MPRRGHLTTLIGDLVASKEHRDRRGLQRKLDDLLQEANGFFNPPQPLEPTVGDEFQGAFATVGSATYASLLLRLQLLEYEGVDSRYGLGHGEVTVFDEAKVPKSQDGPGWWSARDAIERAKRWANSPRTSYARTAFGYPEDRARRRFGEAAAIEAFLLCRDATVDRMSERERRLLLGLLLEQSQTKLAAREGITQGAVSQNLARSGAFAIAAAQWRLEEEL